MIEDTLVHFKTKTAFNTELEAGNIKDTSVVFIKETLELYTHGTLYSLKEVLEQSKEYTDNAVSNKVVTTGTVLTIDTKTQEEYDALETKDPNTLYIIVES